MTPRMVEVQEELGKPIRDVILENLNLNKSVPVTADLLGVHKQQLYKWMEKLGIQKVLYWE